MLALIIVTKLRTDRVTWFLEAFIVNRLALGTGPLILSQFPNMVWAEVLWGLNQVLAPGASDKSEDGSKGDKDDWADTQTPPQGLDVIRVHVIINVCWCEIVDGHDEDNLQREQSISAYLYDFPTFQLHDYTCMYNTPYIFVDVGHWMKETYTNVIIWGG